MLPCPVRLSRSKRFRTLIFGSLAPFDFEPKRFFKAAKRPTSMPLYFASTVFTVINDPGEFRPQVLAVDDTINQPVLQEELAGLEVLRQLQTHRVPDGPLARETDQRPRLRQ